MKSEDVWDIFSTHWAHVIEEFGVQVHSFVLMSNHFHAVLSTPNSNLDEAMLWFQREGARAINRATGRINHVFGGPYRWTAIQSQFQYRHVFRYVYQNPLKSGLVRRVEDYPYSTLYYLHRNLELTYGMEDCCFDREGVLDLALWQKTEWLNDRYNDTEADYIRRGLRRRNFLVNRKGCSGRLEDLILK